MKYFAYGLNMLTQELVNRVGKVVDLGNATLTGYIFDFSKLSKYGSGKASIKNGKQNNEVEGALFELSREQMKELDKHEVGYSQHPVAVVVNSKKTFKATAYIANPETVRNGLRPTKDYLENIVNGANEEIHKLSEKYINFLINHKTIDQSRLA